VGAYARYFKLMETPPHVTASPLVARNQKPDKKGTLTSCAAALPVRAVLDSRPGARLEADSRGAFGERGNRAPSL